MIEDTDGLKTIRLDLFGVDPITFIQLQVEIELLAKKLLEPEQYDLAVFTE